MIAFEGIIGSGKTTLARALAAKTGSHVLEEDLSGCPFLEDFFRIPRASRHRPSSCFYFSTTISFSRQFRSKHPWLISLLRRTLCLPVAILRRSFCLLSRSFTRCFQWLCRRQVYGPDASLECKDSATSAFHTEASRRLNPRRCLVPAPVIPRSSTTTTTDSKPSAFD